MIINLPEKEIIKIYLQGKDGSYKIAKKFNCNFRTILRLLKRNNIKIINHTKFKKNNITWNTGLTKKTNKSLRNQGEKISIKLKQYYKEHPEALDKIRKNGIGKTHTEKWKENHKKLMTEKNPFKGKKHTKETKKHLREVKLSKTGEETNNWQGGKTTLNNLIRSNDKSSAWTSQVFVRDNFTCQKCFKKSGRLNAHHKKRLSLILKDNHISSLKQAINCKEIWDINNGITLCKDCHKKETIKELTK